MSVESAIHEMWNQDSSLVELVAAERVLTGLAQGAIAFPYVTLERRPELASTRTSSGVLVERPIVRINIWDDDLDRAKEVARRALACFNRAERADDGGRILDFRRIQYHEEQQTSGAWLVTSDYRVLRRQ